MFRLGLLMSKPQHCKDSGHGVPAGVGGAGRHWGAVRGQRVCWAAHPAAYNCAALVYRVAHRVWTRYGDTRYTVRYRMVYHMVKNLAPGHPYDSPCDLND